MADSAVVRVTGPVLGVEVRSGTTRGDSPRPYRIVTARVLVGDGVSECTLPEGFSEPSRGELVDWAVSVSMEVSNRWGAQLRMRVTGEFARFEDVPDLAAGVHAVS